MIYGSHLEKDSDNNSNWLPSQSPSSVFYLEYKEQVQEKRIKVHTNSDPYYKFSEHIVCKTNLESGQHEEEGRDHQSFKSAKKTSMCHCYEGNIYNL